MTVLVGTSGFAFKEWKGPFYPEDLKDDLAQALAAIGRTDTARAAE